MSALIWCPFADQDGAVLAGRQLIDEGLVACVNVLPAIRSIYTWQGKTNETAEIGALFKTDAALLERAVARLAELHPYETPAVLGWRIDAAAAETAAWLGQLTGQPA